ncbi:hypothetical protein [Thioclava sp. GXIMD2076]|uniref:hypothetical protein n=1 Tax=Thioclava sp. GXIMD2076 TaxID=3131931 RepID=UPI0030CB86CB
MSLIGALIAILFCAVLALFAITAFLYRKVKRLRSALDLSFADISELSCRLDIPPDRRY